jgi:hypothetical protein
MVNRSFLGAAAVLVSVATLVSPLGAHAQAYCALRDPTPLIYELFPGATSYRSHVSTVDEATRDAVRAVLPFTLHARELGQHTLYAVMAGKEQIGLVHVRSEASDWGVVEIAWAINLQGTLQDFRFQRCRGGSCNSRSLVDLRELLRGASLGDVRGLLTTDGAALKQELLVGADEPARRLATVVLRSGAKTLAVTDIVWRSEL